MEGALFLHYRPGFVTLTGRIDTLTEENAVANPRDSSGTKVQRGTLGGPVGTWLEDFIIFEGRSALSC